MNSWAVSACYPRSTFYPLSDGPSIQNHRITMTCFRTCSRRHARSQAGLCHCTNLLMSDSGLMAFVVSPITLWRRPKSNYLNTHRNRITNSTLTSNIKGGISRGRLHANWRPTLLSLPTYHTSRAQCLVSSYSKVRGVFPSPCRRVRASSSEVHSLNTRVGDSTAIITPFVRVGLHPTRNFRYLRTVIVTAPICRASIKSFACADPIN